MVTVAAPVAADADAVSVSVALPPALTEAGLKLAVTPAGSPLALNAIDCAPPETTAVLTVAAPLAPCWIESDAGETATEKSFAAAPESVTSSYQV